MQKVKKFVSFVLTFSIMLSVLVLNDFSALINAKAESGVQYHKAASAAYMGNTYALYNENLSWTAAKEVCEKLGGHLAVITSAEEQKVISDMVAENKKETVKGYWIGLYNTDETGTWRWITEEPFVFSCWGDGEPDNENGIENYGEQFCLSNKWNDSADNYTGRGFICEFEAQFVPKNIRIFNNHIYMLFNESLSWTDSKMYCEKMGGHLVTITTYEEQNFLNEFLQDSFKKFYWIGCTDSSNELFWEWITGEKFEYENWDKEESNTSNAGQEDCAYIYACDFAAGKKKGMWNDSTNIGDYNYSVDEIGFVCEIETEQFKPSQSGGIGNNFYEVYDECMTWTAAEEYAKTRGGHLATVTSAEEDALVKKICDASLNDISEYWLGGYRMANNSNFAWNNRESFIYSNWSTGAPDNRKHFNAYVEYERGVGWNDVNNLGKRGKGAGFVIEYENQEFQVTVFDDCVDIDVVLANSSVGANRKYSIPANCLKPGYTTTWYLDKNRTALWNPEEAINRNINLYAKRTPENYVVNFNYNGGNGDTPIKVVTYDEQYGTLPKADRSGYSFLGWYDSGELKIKENSVVKILKDETFCAKWLPKKFIVTFDANGGHLETENEYNFKKEVLFDSVYGELPVPTKKGFKFNGWLLKDNNAVITDETKVSAPYNHILYADWQPRQVINCSLISGPDKAEYVLGDKVDLTGMKILATYDNGDQEVVTAGFIYADIPFVKCGVQKFSVSYSGFEISFDVRVEKGIPKNLYISSFPTKNEYFVGETLDTSGLKLEAVYQDGSREEITEGFSCSVSILRDSGTQRIKIMYQGASVNFYINVYDVKLIELSLSHLPKKLNYGINDKIDLSGLEIKAVYNNFSSKKIDDNYRVVYDFSTAGVKNVLIIYKEGDTEVSAAFTVNVTEKARPDVYVADAKAIAGDKVSVPVIIENNPGVMGFSVSIKYNKEMFTPVLVSRSPILNYGMINDNIETGQDFLKIVYTGTENFIDNGQLFTVDFNINKNAKGIYNFEIAYDPNDTFDEMWNAILLNCRSGKVTVKNEYWDSKPSVMCSDTEVRAGSNIDIPFVLSNFNNTENIKISLLYDDYYFSDFLIKNTECTVNTSKAGSKIIFDISDIKGDGTLFVLNIKTNSCVFGRSEIQCLSTDVNTESFVINIINPDANSFATVECDDIFCTPGNVVDIPVYIHNNPGLSGFVFNFNYDSNIIKPLSIVISEPFYDGVFENNIGQSDTSFMVVWSCGRDISRNGVMFYIKAEVLNYGTTALCMDYCEDSTFNEKNENVLLQCKNASICSEKMVFPKIDKDSVVDDKNGYISGLAERIESLNDFVDINSKYNAVLNKKNQYVGTGDSLDIYWGDKLVKTYTIIIYGDVNNDGECNGMDAVIVSALNVGMIGTATLSIAEQMSADCNHDGVVDNNDTELMKKSGIYITFVNQCNSRETIITN